MSCLAVSSPFHLYGSIIHIAWEPIRPGDTLCGDQRTLSREQWPCNLGQGSNVTKGNPYQLLTTWSEAKDVVDWLRLVDKSGWLFHYPLSSESSSVTRGASIRRWHGLPVRDQQTSGRSDASSTNDHGKEHFRQSSTGNQASLWDRPFKLSRAEPHVGTLGKGKILVHLFSSLDTSSCLAHTLTSEEGSSMPSLQAPSYQSTGKLQSELIANISNWLDIATRNISKEAKEDRLNPRGKSAAKSRIYCLLPFTSRHIGCVGFTDSLKQYHMSSYWQVFRQRRWSLYPKGVVCQRNVQYRQYIRERRPQVPASKLEHEIMMGKRILLYALFESRPTSRV